jgi:hypothetical protein
MLEKLAKVNKALWTFIELGFLIVLLCVLVFLIMGPSSGVFVLAVMENIYTITGKVNAANLIGIAILIGLFYAVKARMKS